MTPLDAVLARAAEVRRVAADCEAGQPLGAAVEAALVAATGEAAPLELWSIGDRVLRGGLTWPDVWCDPHAQGSAGTSLVQTVLAHLARERVTRPTVPSWATRCSR